MNSMREIRLEKVTLNLGCGDDANKIEKARKLLEMLTHRKPSTTLSKRRSTFGVAKNKPIGVKVTLRKRLAEEFLQKALQAVENKLKISQFDSHGNFSFGIRAYIDIPGVKYSHDVGLIGLDVSATPERIGYRVIRRSIKRGKLGRYHFTTKEEVINWLKDKFGTEVVS